MRTATIGISNRASARWGGDTNGATLRETSYTPNLLNQYTSVVTPGYKAILGAALATNAVTVNSGATTRKGEYFHRELSIANGSGPVWQSVTVSSGGSNVTGNVLFPPYSQGPTYDADGNLTADGLWTYTWDAENRLLSVTSQSTVPAAARVKLEFAYDHKGRRIQKIVSTWNGSAYVPQSTNRFVYDGWNLLAILAPDSSLLISFLWGSDLSGSLQGAGGVGGLLAVTVHTGANAGTYFPAYDGNGNVMALVSAADGAAVAQYEYGPFGEVLRVTGPLAQANPFVFSTKFCDWETGLYYYGYRYYDPVAGRWLSRDPIQENGGRNVYCCSANDLVNRIDPRGHWHANVHRDMTRTMAYAASFRITDAVVISEADQGVDSLWKWESSLPLVGQQSRHMFYPSYRGYADSRDYWYETELGIARNRLETARTTGDVRHCVEAAVAFGKGLHSRQDRSAHRPWPAWPRGTEAWHPTTMHPAWWDAYDWPDELGAWGLSEDFWNDEGNRNLQTPGWGEDYIPWYSTAGQFQSQAQAREAVERETAESIRGFVDLVRQNCVCAPFMLQ